MATASNLGGPLSAWVRQYGAAQKPKVGDLCPRCAQRADAAHLAYRAAHPTAKTIPQVVRPGRLYHNTDLDLSCFVCGHIEYVTPPTEEKPRRRRLTPRLYLDQPPKNRQEKGR